MATVARAARAASKPPAVVLMSGNAPDDIARPAGVPLLTKPFTAEQLARAIEEGSPR